MRHVGSGPLVNVDSTNKTERLTLSALHLSKLTKKLYFICGGQDRGSSGSRSKNALWLQVDYINMLKKK